MMRTFVVMTLCFVLVGGMMSCRKHHDVTDDFQESTERGLKGIKDAQALQQQSRWQHPTDALVKAAIEKYELGRTEVHSVVITAKSQPDEFNNLTVNAKVNGESRSYRLSKSEDGSWAVRPAGDED